MSPDTAAQLWNEAFWHVHAAANLGHSAHRLASSMQGHWTRHSMCPPGLLGTGTPPRRPTSRRTVAAATRPGTPTPAATGCQMHSRTAAGRGCTGRLPRMRPCPSRSGTWQRSAGSPCPIVHQSHSTCTSPSFEADVMVARHSHLSLMSVRHTSQVSGWHRPGCLLQSSGGPLDGGGGRGAEPFSTLTEPASSFSTAAFLPADADRCSCGAAVRCWPFVARKAWVPLVLGVPCRVGSAEPHTASTRQKTTVAAALRCLLAPVPASAMQEARGSCNADGER